MVSKNVRVGLLGLAVAAPALAQHEGGGGSPFAGDIGNALWTVVIFGVVLFVLGKYAWGPILQTLQGREDFIRESLEKARHDREEAEARLREYVEKINSARSEATAIVDEGRRDAEVVKRRIEEDARAEAERIVERGKREIAIATETAVKELYTTSARLATEIAARVLKREIAPQDHERLVADAIEGLAAADRRGVHGAAGRPS